MISLIGSSAPAAPTPAPSDPPSAAPASNTALTGDSLSSLCSSALSGIDGQISACMQKAETGDPASVIELQSLVADRQMIVTMCSNLAASFAQTQLAEVQNIGR
jgi:hypothetical protein